jgi:CheY-like chemotaxis protein/signal transduction histidine kinase/HAMP domain-containing protein
VKASLRTKLRLIIGSTTISLTLLVGVSLVFAYSQLTSLTQIESRLVPKLELAPKLERDFEHLRQHFQDAVAAEDRATLAEAENTRNHMLALLADSKRALEPSEAASLRWAVQDYYQAGRDVSERLISGETGEKLVEDMQRVQMTYKRTQGAIQRVAQLRPRELTQAIESVRSTTIRVNAYGAVIGLLGLLLVAGLSSWASRGLLRGLSSISEGLSRFSTGDFSQPVPVELDDELGRVALDANRMADNLNRLGDERDRLDRTKTAHAGLSAELMGELHLAAVAERALTFLARAVNARAGALYLATDDGVFRLECRFALPKETSPGALASFRPGESLLGEAARSEELTVIDDVPAGFFPIQSGLGEADPKALVIVPLWQGKKTIGVIELALWEPCTDEMRELLRLVRRNLVMALEAARSRVKLHELLEESQSLAEQLATREEELRRNNEELTTQQEELRVTNDELVEQRRELEARNTELEATRQRVQQKAEELAKVSAYKSQFLANMSHELRTPLNSMLLLSHFLSENEAGNLNEKQIEQLLTIHGAGQDLLGLINEVLDLAKIESGRQEVNVEEVELGQFAAYARRVFEPLARDKGLALQTELAAELPLSVCTDVQRVERILTNLLGNAIKFTERGEVRLKIHPASPALFGEPGGQRRWIAFSVTDTGIGIPLDAQERVFAPFEQLESQSRRHGGTGLGLAIARESAQLLGGDLRVQSSPGKGSTFTCYLPERPISVAPPARASEQAPAATDDRATLEPSELYVLVIEDDPVLSEQLVSIIHARKLKALVAGTGAEGLRMARERRPVGIVLDVRLPDIDGWAVMERLRNDPSTRSIPVHFVTGVEAAERGLGLGAVGYLTKPVTHADLAGAVRALLVAPGATSSEILLVEDDAAQGESLRDLLQREDFAVRYVQSAEEALTALRERRYGCMILDLGLPGLDGLGLLHELRKSPGEHMPRVLVHTGRSLSKHETRELEAYAEAVIVKDERSTDRLLDEVRLFVHQVHAPATAPRRPSERPRASSDVSLRGMSILVAEDDMRTVYALSALLRGRGASVLVADTGKEALAVLDAHPDVDGVLMDIMMPEMDGYEALRRLRKDPRFGSLPVIALTARAMKGERERCLEAGATEYLAKPLDGERLLSAVSACFIDAAKRPEIPAGPSDHRA